MLAVGESKPAAFSPACTASESLCSSAAMRQSRRRASTTACNSLRSAFVVLSWLWRDSTLAVRAASRFSTLRTSRFAALQPFLADTASLRKPDNSSARCHSSARAASKLSSARAAASSQHNTSSPTAACSCCSDCAVPGVVDSWVLASSRPPAHPLGLASTSRRKPTRLPPAAHREPARRRSDSGRLSGRACSTDSKSAKARTNSS
mmetsp:Transcript_94931/g.306470  ORF Transcript_94931/g.306470 Transcript_94931/m.306470 type:complete len:206 (-) Transcript_94931:2124-2741(-)